MNLPEFTPLNTKRLCVRSVSAADLRDLFDINGDDNVTAFLPYATWKSADDAANWLARMQALAATGAAVQLVIERKQDGKVIGTVLLFKYDAANARIELGYVLGRKHWRQGFAKEALQAVCAQAFDGMKLRRIEAEVHPDNYASNALMLSLTFVQEGRFRKRWVTKGNAHDTNIYGCLADEWLARQRRGAA